MFATDKYFSYIGKDSYVNISQRIGIIRQELINYLFCIQKNKRKSKCLSFYLPVSYYYVAESIPYS